MSNIINKSNHPVQIKRINVRIWKFRDEIEKAIAIRLIESNEQGVELNIEDIKKFYTRKKPKYLDPDYDPAEDNDEDDEEIGTDGLDSSGNVVDEESENSDKEDSKTPEEKEEKEEKEEEKEEKEEEKEEKEEDDEAAKLATEMLGDNAASTPEEDEAAKLAAEMLGDQGSSNSDADDLSMLEDQGTPTETTATPKALERVVPDDDRVSYGFALLSDLNMEEMLVFSKDGYTFGQNICIEFLIPKSFTISGEVVGVSHIGRTSKIISETKPDYRVQLEFTYLFETERSNLRDFLKSVEPTIPPAPKKLKRPESDDDGDDEFEDLGF
jgi:hypothetical protein